MNAFSLQSVIFYYIFCIFLSVQVLHATDFRGYGKGAQLALNLSIALAAVTALAYLIYYGIVGTWWLPLILFVLGIIALSMGRNIRSIFSNWWILSLLGFIGWPVCAYMMFHYVLIAK